MIDKLYEVKTPGKSPIGSRLDAFGIEPDAGFYSYTDNENGSLIHQNRVANVYGIVGEATSQIGSVVKRQKMVEIIGADGNRTGFKPVSDVYMAATLSSFGKEKKRSYYQARNADGKLELDQLRNDLLDAVDTWGRETGAFDAATTPVRAAASVVTRPAASFGKVQSTHVPTDSK